MSDLNRMREHLKSNPNDYQTAISYLKKRSSEFVYNQNRKRIKMYQDIKKYKKILKENDNAK